jgi:hypothetical protein
MELIMHYVCLENNQVISIVNYEPSVPNTVTVVSITDSEFKSIEDKTHQFDIEAGRVVPLSAAELLNQQTYNSNVEKLEFLRSTDWKILRHLREKALNVETSMTEEEYLTLENERQQTAKSITV